MMRDAELKVNRLITKQFIAANPSMIALIPRSMVKTGTGSVWADTPPRPVQVVRLLDQSSGAGPTPGTVTTGDGTQRRVEFQLLAEWDAAVGLYDYWVDSSGIKWEVAELLPDNGYERRAQVVRYGES